MISNEALQLFCYWLIAYANAFKIYQILLFKIKSFCNNFLEKLLGKTIS